MPARDEQDYERRRQQIIDGALEVFASKGFEGATNIDIAQAAGIGSPGLIYHYFRNKADLFRQVVEQRAPVVELLNRGDELMALPLREALTLFARAFLQITENQAVVAMAKLVLGEMARWPSVAEMFNSLGPRRAFEFFTRYLERQVELGRLRRMDVGAATRCFLGPLVVYIITREILPQADAGTLDVDTMAATTVDIFLRGIEVAAPREEGSRSGGAAARVDPHPKGKGEAR